MIDPNYTFFLQLISFIVFMVIMSKFVYKPVRTFLENREMKNHNLRQAASHDTEETIKLKDEYSNMLAEAREEAVQIKNDLVKEAKKVAAEELEKARTEQDSKRSEGFALLKKERSTAQEILQKEIDSLSDEIIKKVLIS